MPRVNFGMRYKMIEIGGISFSVHRVVAAVFLGAPASSELVVDHLDGVKTNNHWSNLEYVTSSMNTYRAYQAASDVIRERPALSKPVKICVKRGLLLVP